VLILIFGKEKLGNEKKEGIAYKNRIKKYIKKGK